MKGSTLIRSFVMLLLLSSTSQALAGIIPIFQRIETVNNQPVMAGASSHLVVPAEPNTHIDRQVKNTIRLWINHEYPGYVPTTGPMTITVEFDLVSDYNAAYVNPNDPNRFPGGDPTVRQSLTVVYDPLSATETVDQAIFEFRNAYDVQLTIATITVDGLSATNLPANVVLDNEVIIERYKLFQSFPEDLGLQHHSVDINGDGIKDALRVSWTQQPVGTEHVQLEWTYVNNYGNAATENTQVTYTFDGNATRISTTEHHYEIPLTFNHGYLLYRVRPVGISLNDFTRYVYGAWDGAPENGIASTVSNSYYISPAQAHENEKNWNYSITFAEEGKRKEVISYFDGSLRNRQSVTKTNSNDKVIVGETLYDYAGRPAVQVLPVPVADDQHLAAIKYYDNFTQDVNGQPYYKSKFDADDNTQAYEVKVEGLGMGDGAGKYYSGSNPDKNDQQAFVPDATAEVNSVWQAFPFAQTEYTPDNTGRIRRQGGVGAEFQLGSEHETRYLYGQPQQLELDRLFGPEVGYASHYKKNVVIDPNGQASISYLDQEGRVVATALSGAVPTSLEALPSAAAASVQMDINAFGDQNSQNQLNQNQDGFRFSSQLLVSEVSDYTFTYTLNVPPMADACLPSGICVDCVYDLKLELVDESGANLFNPALSQLTGNFVLNQDGSYTFHENCSGALNYATGAIVIPNLPVGNYSFNKILTINEDAREAYVQLYLEKATCIQSEQDFIDAALSNLDVSDCEVDDCQTCRDKLGSLVEFVAKGYGDENDYYLRRDECNRVCTDEVYDPCQLAYDLMLSDLTPGGQYAEYETEEGVADVTLFPLSILNSGNALSAVDALWRNPLYKDAFNNETAHYLNEDGSVALIQVTQTGNGIYQPELIDNPDVQEINGVLYAYPEQLKDVKDFIGLFERNWAKSLLVYHPEYCYYQTCISYRDKVNEADDNSSASFDELLQKTNNFADALAAKLITIDGSGKVTPNGWNQQSTQHPFDPFMVYQTTYNACGNYATQMGGYYSTGYQAMMPDGALLSIPQLAAYFVNSAYLGSASTTTSPVQANYDFKITAATTVELKDEYWDRLRTLYYAAKSGLLQERADCLAQTQCGINDCIGNQDFDPVASGLIQFSPLSSFASSPYFQGIQPCAAAHWGLYAHKQQRFAGKEILPEVDPEYVSYQMYLQTGQCPATFALQHWLNAINNSVGLVQGTTDVSTLPETFNFFHALDHFNYVGVLPAVTYSGVDNGSSIDASFTADNGTVMTLRLTKNANTPAWSQIINITNLFASGASTFSCDALYEDNSVNPPTYGDFKLYGEILSYDFTTFGAEVFNLESCRFGQHCELNQFGRDMNTLMQSLLQTGPLFNTSPIQITPYTGPGTGGTVTDLFTPVMADVLQALGSPLKWVYDPANHLFKIYNSGDPARYLEIAYNNPEDFPTAGAQYTSFASIRASEHNTFHQVVTFPGNKVVDLYGDMTLHLPNTDPQRLPLGNCELPMALKCDGEEYRNFEDLTQVLEDVLITQPYPANGSFNLFGSAALSNDLRALLGNGPSFSTNTVINNRRYLQFSGLDVDLRLEMDLSLDPDFNFNDIASIRSYNFLGENNGVYGYTMTAVIAGGMNFNQLRTIYVYTTLPIKICSECPESALTSGNDLGVEDNFDQYLGAVNNFNANAGLQAGDAGYLQPVTMQSFVENALQLPLQSYLRYLNHFDPQLDNRQLLEQPNLFVASYGHGVNVLREFGRYTEAVNQYNQRASQQGANSLTAISQQTFVDGRFADGVAAYVDYLRIRPLPNETTLPIAQQNPAESLPVDQEQAYLAYAHAYLQRLQTEQTAGNCPLFGELLPLYSSGEVGKRNLFCATDQLQALEQYTQRLTQESGCMDDLPQLSSCVSTTAREKKAVMQRLFVQYTQAIERYNQSAFAQANQHQLTQEFNSFLELQTGNFTSQCMRAYLTSLEHYSRLEGVIQPDRAVMLTTFDGCQPTTGTRTPSGNTPASDDPEYLAWMDCLNRFLDWADGQDFTEEQSRLIQTIESTLSVEADFNFGYWSLCTDEFCARVNDVIDGVVSQEPIQIFRFLAPDGYCPGITTPPCVPDPNPIVITKLPDAPVVVNDCVEMLTEQAKMTAKAKYAEYVSELMTDLRQRYNAHCLSATETLRYQFTDKTHHYTLYYYDQAGNLIKTVPPEGVELLPMSSDADPLAVQVRQDRKQGTQTVFTTHRLASRYEYNSLNQLIAQSVPDADPLDEFELTLPNGLHKDLTGTRVQMVDAQMGWLAGYVGDLGYLYQTTDGGLTWNRITNLVASDLRKVVMIGNVGFAIGQAGTVLVTRNGGNRWNMLKTWQANTTSGPISLFNDWNDVFMRSTGSNSYEVLFAGDQRRVARLNYVSNTQSETWSLVSGGLTALATDTRITGITGDGTSYYLTAEETRNGLVSGHVFSKGYTTGNWAEQPYLQNDSYDVAQAGTYVFMAGRDGRLYRMDATSTTAEWQLIETDVTLPIRKLAFYDATEGFALMGAIGTLNLYHTINGGVNWEQVSAVAYRNISVSNLNKVVMAVGNGGRIDLYIQNLDKRAEALSMAFKYPSEDLTAGWVNLNNSTGDQLRCVVADANGNLYYAPDLNVPNPAWEIVPSGAAGEITQIEAFNFASQNEVRGVLRTSTNGIFGFRVNGAGELLTATLTGAMPTVSAMAMSTASNQTRVYVYNASNNRIGSYNLAVTGAGGYPYSAINTILSGSPSGAAAMTVQGTNKLVLLSPTNQSSLLGVTPTSITSQRVLTNTLLPGALHGIKQAGTTIVAYGANGQLWQKTTNGMSLLETGVREQVRDVAQYASTLVLAGNNNLLLNGSISGTVFTPQTLFTEADLEETAGVQWNAIAVNPGNTGEAYVAGTDGRVLYLTSSGSNKKLLQINGARLNGVAFVNGKAIVAADGCQLYSMQGGQVLKLKEIYGPRIRDVHFRNNQLGSILADNFMVRNTNDGGASWQIVKPTTQAGAQDVFNRIYRYDERLSLLLGDAKIYKVLDNAAANSGLGGLSNIVETATHPGTGAFYFGMQQGGGSPVVAINRLNVNTAVTTYPLSVTLIKNITGTGVLNGLTVLPTGHFAVVTGNQVFRYFDAAGTAGLVKTITGQVLNDLYMPDNQHATLVGNAGAYYKLEKPGVNAMGVLTAGNFDPVSQIGTADPHVVTATSQVNLVSISFATPDQAIYVGAYTGTVGNAAQYPYVRRAYDPADRYTSRFWYDRLGRLTLSRNGRQDEESKYSYTLYDALGRVIEVGEKKENTGSDPQFKSIFGSMVADYYNPATMDEPRYQTWVAGNGARAEVTRTAYSNESNVALPAGMVYDPATGRNRITHVAYYENWTGNENSYAHATFYQYDIHGNVKTLYQDNPKIAALPYNLASERIKRIDYSYDLISGNVHRVSVQDTKADQWHHSYAYDADNRITHAYTDSRTPFLGNDAHAAGMQNEVIDNPDWQNEARYFYYDHGPLARTELGQHNVQGLDYVYNLQGWLKGVNSTTLDVTRDPGQDGYSLANHSFAPDVYGFGLDYFANDYRPIAGAAKMGQYAPLAGISGSDIDGASLFNGNIRSMQTTITNPTTRQVLPLGNKYRYDQLQRLKESRSFVNIDLNTNMWLNSGTYDNRYYNSFTYDANGNIETQIRHNSQGTQIENLSYKYHDVGGKRKRNRLYHVNETINPANFADDIDDQGTFYPEGTANKFINGDNNYVYDAEGRLIQDKSEHIASIVWRVDGKIKEITRDNGVDRKVLRFDYDAMGRRIAKHVINNLTQMPEKTTYYLLDAQGNTMNVYEWEVNPNMTTSYTLSERHIYGSARIGMLTTKVDMLQTNAVSYTLASGSHNYELVDHRGNVNAVVTDRKIPLTIDNVSVSGYLAQIVTASDYSPFGCRLDQRAFNTSLYRYSFQSQESDDEIKGEGNSYNYTYRMHDPRLGRFFARDPLAAKYPHNSPYAFSENRVLDGVELEGLEWEMTTAPDGSSVISVNVKLIVEEGVNLTEDQLNAYKNAIIDQFNKTISDVSNGKIKGTVTFNGGDESDRIIPSFNIFLTKNENPEDPNSRMIGGVTTYSHAGANIVNKKNEYRSPEDYAITAVHELFHTLGLYHPFETTQSEDTKLIHEGQNNYRTTAQTDPYISFNIMMYTMLFVNGAKVQNQMVETGIPKDKLTKGQLEFIINSIQLQMNGCGMMQSNRKNLTQDEIKMIYDEYNNYWNQGVPVLRVK